MWFWRAGFDRQQTPSWLVGLYLVCLVFLAACSSLPARVSPSAVALTPEAGGETPSPTAPELPTQTAPPLDEPLTLRLWLPVQFDPNANTLAAGLLNERLNQFTGLHPELTLDVRVKETYGAAGLLASLSTAASAAPQTLPDVVALPAPLIEAAALKGLIHPLNDLSGALANSDWFPYAQTMGSLQGESFALPFAADMLVMVYRPEAFETPRPQNWAGLLEAARPLGFSTEDPQALFSLFLYQSAGGQVIDPDGRPTLQLDPLTQTLALYQQASTAGVLPAAPYDSDLAAWDAFLNGETDLVITWAARYRSLPPQTARQYALAVFPSLSSQPFSLATGWGWSLAGASPENRLLAVQLAEYLSAVDFLGAWSQVSGYLPPRRAALDAWSPGSLQGLALQLSPNAALLPAEDVIAVIAPALRLSVQDVVQRQADPAAAAANALASLRLP
jgi:ABC-type glycerol-3-phosphate transport system substrate-binding protein